MSIKQRKIKIDPRIKLNYNIDTTQTACSPPFLLRSVNPKQARSQKVAVKRKETRARHLLVSHQSSRRSRPNFVFITPSPFEFYFDRETREERTANSLRCHTSE